MLIYIYGRESTKVEKKKGGKKRIAHPALLFWSEAARKATHTFLTLLAPILELLPIN